MKPARLRHKDLPAASRTQMNLYALAAGAAGVSLLALAEPADAQIVYTPTYKIISQNSVVPLDLNSDGKDDLVFSNAAKSGFGYRVDQLEVAPSAGNKILRFQHTTSALPAGVKVGAGTSFSGNARIMAFGDVAYDTPNICLGQWKDAQGRYLGLEFAFDGKAHFGWVRLSVICRGADIDAAITGYAYETVAGKSILTGQTQDQDSRAATAPRTSSLGALALSWESGRLASKSVSSAP